MPGLTNKTILIISPQAWGIMFLSKHHYAIELARRGNRVYFLNPPGEGWEVRPVNGKKVPDAGRDKDMAAGGRDKDIAAGGRDKDIAAGGRDKDIAAGGRAVRRGGVDVVPSGILPNLWFIRHDLNFPYKLKFHALPLFHALMHFQARRILRAIGRPIDIVWSFDLGYQYPFRFFGKSLKVFHPVDEPLTTAAIRSATGADVLFAVTREIVAKYHRFDIPRHFINHGVSNEFFEKAHSDEPVDALSEQLPAGDREDAGDAVPDTANAPAGPRKVRIGFSGNLLRPDIDRETFLKIVSDNPRILFECWGSYKLGQSNIGGAADEATAAFAAALLAQPNILLHGPVPSERLAKEIHRMDGFIICYDIHKDQSRGTNYHKVMEYLSTGKVIVSNNVTTYKDRPDLIQMVAERDDNRRLPALFSEVVANLAEYNSPEARNRRIAFARENTYPKQLDRIAAILEGIRPAAADPEQTRIHGSQ